MDAENVLSLWEEADTRSPECQNGMGKKWERCELNEN